MNKVVTFIWLSLVIAVSAGCAQKPAYSDMETKSSRDQNQNKNQSEEESAPSPVPEQPPATAGGAQPEAAPAAVPFKSPSFLDAATGGIKDLPSYPNSYRVNIQVGPIQGLNTMSLGFTSRDPMDKISAFFERVIKGNKWTVSDKVIDQEFSEWNLVKGAGNNAKVQVKKDEKTGMMNIVMVRSEKLESAGK